MANVIFKKGTRAQFDAIPVKDPNTLYWLYDVQQLYNGDVMYSSAGSAGRDGFDMLFCKSIAVSVDESTVLSASDLNVPEGRTIDVGDMCICKNGVVAQVTGVNGDDITVNGLFKMSGDGYTSAYEYVRVTPATTWVIQHNLGVQRPAITCYDNETPENEIIGDIVYQDVNTAKVSFSVALSGRAIVRG